MTSERIAIVGQALRLPGADADAGWFWERVARGVDASREVPDGRWPRPAKEWLDSRIAHPDSVYSTRGYFLEPFTPDLDGLAIEPSLVSELDVLFHIVLDVGNRAWRSAQTGEVNRSRVGVVLGNICLPTAKSNAICRQVLGGTGFQPVHPLNRYVAGLPAGLLAKSLRLGGGSFTLDAACASSLYAIKLACDELLTGRADAMLAGGVNGSDSHYTQMGFAQLRALSVSGRCSPFDAKADGLMVGEGAAIFVLKRLSDALQHGDTILATIAGVGLSNDMHGNLLAPAKEGQLRAMRAAYQQAGWRPQDVDLIECHATGTLVGDAVEYDSLRELWGESGWKPGQCAIGSVKSTVGHLLTGAGAAATAKVLAAIQHGVRPPQANFDEPNPALRYLGGPFTVLNEAQEWPRREGSQPRRAAVSGFGFGGVNAHLLLEEWTGESVGTRAPAPQRKVSSVPVAIVGMAAHFGPWSDLRMFQERIFGPDRTEPSPKVNGWGLASEQCPPGFFIEELHVPTDRFRIPPKELEEMLPQQLLMLQVAAAALDDAGVSTEGDDPNAGTFIGLGLDPNTTNFHLRWSKLACGENVDHLPALNANRVMGALGSIAASRIARAFHFGGPSHTVCSEEASAARAIELAVRALQAGELDRVLAGGVDLAGDPRLVIPGEVKLPAEGAAAFVLKRLADAERDGDRVYAVIRGVGVASDRVSSCFRAMDEFRESANQWAFAEFSTILGASGAASGGADLARACLALHNEINPDTKSYWLVDTANGPRRVGLLSEGADGTSITFTLEEAAAKPGDCRQPLGARNEAIFVVEGNTPEEIEGQIRELKQFVGWALPTNSSGNWSEIAGAVGGQCPPYGIEALARRWYRTHPLDSRKKLAQAFVAGSTEELRQLLGDPASGFGRAFSTSQDVAGAKIAFVFPGSGNQFDSMGRDLGAQFPEVLRRQQTESTLLRSQFTPEHFWFGSANDAPPRDLMFGQVTVGSLVSDLLQHFGVKPDAMIGLSLGESAGLFGIRAWRSRDEMFQRMQQSTLFNSDLAPPYDSARNHWNADRVDWFSGVIAASPDEVNRSIRAGSKAFLLIVNTPNECVIGGERTDVEQLAAAIGKPFFPLSGVTLAHCEAGRPVEQAYRELHTLPVTPTGVTVYSGAWGNSYEVTDASAADSITAGLLHTIDFPAVVNAAYRDGARVFLEVGPGSSCTRMIGSILEGKPHLARAVHTAKTDAVSQLLRTLAALIAERIPVNLESLYGGESECMGHREAKPAGPEVVIPVGMSRVAAEPQPIGLMGPRGPISPIAEDASPIVVPATAGLAPIISATADVQVAVMQAQEVFLRVNQRMIDSAARLIAFQTDLLQRAAGFIPAGLDMLSPAGINPATRAEVPRSLTFEQCCAFAVGKLSDALGPLFAEADQFPTRVRLPDGPLQLVDRITLIEGEPKSMTFGRVVTEHTVRPDRWYLENGRIPTAISVEAGQADLFLSGFLGIDFETRGLAVYRLLDAVVSFHRGLPKIGETVVYDIRIDEFSKQGDSWLFRFRFDGTVNGEPFITMRNGVAGFFTETALAAGRGIVQTSLDKQRLPGKKPNDWVELIPFKECSLDAKQVESLRRGDLVAAFGEAFAQLPLQAPCTIPGGMLRLVDRVPLIDPAGGRFGIGFVRAEFDIHPDDWFLTCHFVDDQVMPGTLMYECCLHTLRIFLLRMGWVGESGEVTCEPIPGIDSRLKCRGQVIATTKTVTYEVTVKELGYGPEPFCLADALMYADGKPIVEITNMCLKMSGLTREKLQKTWQSPPVATGGHQRFQYSKERILAYAIGPPSEAFGEPYRIFDSGRILARLPGPPFLFVDRITPTAGTPFMLEAGSACSAEYDVPPDAWYFEANCSEKMPFSVLLEIALQPCGWLAAWCGSALTNKEDIKFRNLGGKATQFLQVTPDIGTLGMTAKLTNVSKSAGMIIQHFDMKVTSNRGTVYEGTTYFGFFTKDQLANQVGIREAKVPWPIEPGERGELPHDPPFPAPMLRMVDRIDCWLPNGGSKRLGLVVGRIAVDPSMWFFKAHFYQDPVWPGSLGLESFLQLLKYVGWKKWGGEGWQTPVLRAPHSWIYRGQVLPTDREVTVLLEVTAIDEAARRLTANGFLTVDGRVIYQMNEFTLDYPK